MNPREAIRTLAAVDLAAPPEVHEATELVSALGEYRAASTSAVEDLRRAVSLGEVRPDELLDRLRVAAVDAVIGTERYHLATDVEHAILDRAKAAIAARGDAMFDQLRARFDSALAVLNDALLPAPTPPPTWNAMRVLFELPRTEAVDTAEAEVRAVVDARRLLGECGWGTRGEDVAWFILHPGNHTRVIEAGRVWGEHRTITSLMSYGFEPNLNTLPEVDAILATRAEKPGVRRRNRLPETPPVETRVPVVR